MQTYYEILGVSETATQDEIRKAFKILIRKWHPDMNPGNDSVRMTQLLNEAYSVLSDVSKRRQYDSKLSSTRRQTSSKPKSSSKSNSCGETAKSTDNTKESTNSTRKLADDIIDELKKTRDALFVVLVSMKIEKQIDTSEKIKIIKKTLKDSDKVFKKSLAKVGINFDTVLKCDFSECKIDLEDLNKVLNVYNECLIVKKGLLDLMKQYYDEERKIWTLEDLENCGSNDLKKEIEREIDKKNNYVKELIKNKIFKKNRY